MKKREEILESILNEDVRREALRVLHPLIRNAQLNTRSNPNDNDTIRGIVITQLEAKKKKYQEALAAVNTALEITKSMDGPEDFVWRGPK